MSARELDLGVVTSGVDLPAGLVTETWLHDELLVVAASDHGDAAAWVAFRAGSPTHAVLERHVPDATIAAELGTVAAVKAFVRAGMGAALLSRTAVQRELCAGELVEVPTSWTPLTRHLVLAHRGVPKLSPAAARLRLHLLQAGHGVDSAGLPPPP